jgi:hypothetical protein
MSNAAHLGPVYRFAKATQMKLRPMKVPHV